MIDFLGGAADGHSSKNWRLAASCRRAGVDMTPEPEEGHVSRGEDVMLAKKVCRSCSVQELCMQAGAGETGVYAGLTLDERQRKDMGQGVLACVRCGLDCVPLNPGSSECDTCAGDLGGRAKPETFKNNIIAMVKEEKTYTEIAERFGLRKEAVSRACKRWGVQSLPGRRLNNNDDLAPCGTPAAVVRHKRRGEDMSKCACSRPGACSRTRTRKNGWVKAA